MTGLLQDALITTFGAVTGPETVLYWRRPRFHLSRVFAGRSELSMQNLERILEALHASLVIQPEENLAERVSPERAAKALATAAG